MERCPDIERVSSTTHLFCGLRLSWLLALFSVTQSAALRGAEFELDGQRVELQDLTPQISVHYRSVRFNRPADAWLMEVFLRNDGAESVPSPLILMADSWSGSSGPTQTDDRTPNPAGKPYWNLSPQIPDGSLAPGLETVPRTI